MLLENVFGEVYEKVNVSLTLQIALDMLFQNYWFLFGDKEGRQSKGKYREYFLPFLLSFFFYTFFFLYWMNFPTCQHKKEGTVIIIHFNHFAAAQGLRRITQQGFIPAPSGRIAHTSDGFGTHVRTPAPAPSFSKELLTINFSFASSQVIPSWCSLSLTVRQHSGPCTEVWRLWQCASVAPDTCALITHCTSLLSQRKPRTVFWVTFGTEGFCCYSDTSVTKGSTATWVSELHCGKSLCLRGHGGLRRDGPSRAPLRR